MSAAAKMDAVFEGGGVKGIGLVGALSVAASLGFQYMNVAGTSAGALLASLVAAGYTAAEIKDLMHQLDYTQFKDKTPESSIPVIGPFVSLFIRKGIYAGDHLETLVRELLAKKNIKTFSDLIIPEYKNEPRYRYKLQVVASDISRGRLLILPRDAQVYGIDPDTLDVAQAVRMSMSIPYFFKPVTLGNLQGSVNYIVDGAILSNYPVSIFDDGSPNPPWPTLGFKLVDPNEEKPHLIRGPLSLLGALFSTMMEAHDARYIADKDFVRTIPIPTLGVQTTEFDLSAARRDMLYQSGVAAAQDFFNRWDFEKYKKQYRQKSIMRRSQRVWKNEK